ncbi:hypothetical protein J437_LFUL010425 [Ladona fulva]|uniref:UDENN domain-containing protein n=1 Tax=Ladona fulva TaxID=123851 RepID=A0A8K0JVE1_LADFU|nr:hypothetical protein J437_LFUL010425 [Ladona fulva]
MKVAMADNVTLLSFCIIERDSNGDVLWTWIYPSITTEQRSLVTRKCGLEGDQNRLQPFLYGRFRSAWYYINSTEVFESDSLPRVKQFALSLWAKDFNPEKYETLCRILSKTYCKTGNPIAMLQLYLSVLTRGSCMTKENGTFFVKEFDQQKNLVNTNVKELIKTFGLETILIYTALLLKKRIIVYHHSIEVLLKSLRTFPALMWHRKTWDMLFPWVDIHPDELMDLRGRQYYVGGCRDASICSRKDLYDILINLPAKEINIAPRAKESMIMTKTHKEIALFMMQLAENTTISEQQVVHEIAKKTGDLLAHLRSLATVNTSDGKPMVCIETLRERALPPALENFLFNLAIAENMMML